jgi:hypothetical protein
VKEYPGKKIVLNLKFGSHQETKATKSRACTGTLEIDPGWKRLSGNSQSQVVKM